QVDDAPGAGGMVKAAGEHPGVPRHPGGAACDVRMEEVRERDAAETHAEAMQERAPREIGARHRPGTNRISGTGDHDPLMTRPAAEGKRPPPAPRGAPNLPRHAARLQIAPRPAWVIRGGSAPGDPADPLMNAPLPSNADSIPSPALLVLADRLEANLQRMLRIAGGPGRLRPHVKTHK